MNRSFSNSFKHSSYKKNKKCMKRSESNINFQTIFKTRDSHSVLKIMDNKLDKKIQLCQNILKPNQVSRFEGLKIQQKQERNIQKQQISEDLPKKKRKQSTRFERQKSICQNIQPVKYYSQPKLLKKKSSQNSNQASTFTNLDQLSKKATQLLQLQLMKKSENRLLETFKLEQNPFQSELQNIITQIQQYQTSRQNQNPNLQSQIKQIKQKIQILQKIMAQNYTQSQILKKYYFMKKITRKSLSRCDNKFLRQSISSQIQPIKPTALNYSHPSMEFSTIAQSSFCKPDRQAYQKQPSFSSKYTPNRQPLQRSTYQSQFLNYGKIPVYSIKNSSQLSTLGLKDKKITIYQNDFKEKKIQLVDSKELDCRKDKFKQSKITFMPKKMFDCQNSQKENQYKTHKKTSKHKFLFEPNNFSNAVQSYTFYKQNSEFRNSDWPNRSQMKTQYRFNFSGQKIGLQCLAKDSNLNNLKYELKRTFNA